MGTPITKHFLDSLLDPKGLLSTPNEVKEKKVPYETFETTQEREVRLFIEKHGREPRKDSPDITESLLAVRYQKMKEKKKKDKAEEKLMPWETEEGKKIFDMLECNDDIFDFSNSPIIKEKDRAKADFIARQKPCSDFDEKYADLFKKIQNAIDTGHRKIIPYTGGQPKQGDFVVVNGIIIFVEWIDELRRRTQEHGINGMDARTKCIFSNGKQSNMYLQSLVRTLYDTQGKLITVDDREDPLSGFFPEQKQTENDIETGYIYVLKTLSQDEEIKPMANKMYKIGVTKGSVEKRIANAENESTYLCAPVQIVQKIKCFNINSQKLEDIIHKFFAAVQVPVQVNMNGKLVMATEWYSVPLSVINKVAQLVISGEIVNYRYEPTIYDVVKI